ncbi:MAG: glycosyltransferase family 4 protein, partial [Planctomycetota bacterium]
MHVLLLHQNFVDHAHPGGTRHLELAKHLVEMGHAVTIVASNLDYLTGNRIEGGREQWMSGVRVLRAPALPTLHRSLLWRVVSYISFMFTSFWTGLRAGKADVVIGTTPPLFQLPSACGISMLRRVPFLLEVRDLWPRFAVEMGVLKNRLLIKVAEFAERMFYRSATHIVVNSPAYETHVIANGIQDSNVSTIPNGVDTSMFDPKATGKAVRDEFGLTDEFVVTYAGALGQANDLQTLIRAAELVSDDPKIQVLIAGGGNRKQQLQDLVAKLGLSNVRFVGHFPKQRIGELLAASDACVACLQNITAFKTTYPNKVFDYMAAGRPV